MPACSCNLAALFPVVKHWREDDSSRLHARLRIPCHLITILVTCAQKADNRDKLHIRYVLLKSYKVAQCKKKHLSGFWQVNR
jgi:hypothetical protein